MVVADYLALHQPQYEGELLRSYFIHGTSIQPL